MSRTQPFSQTGKLWAFSKLGRQWRIWPETLREEMERRTKKSDSGRSSINPRLPLDLMPAHRPHSMSPSVRAAEKEFDALLKSRKQVKK